jgi:transcriptional regulator with XRE-family HTH domain
VDESGRAGTNGRAVVVDLMNNSAERTKESAMSSLLREVLGDVLRRARNKQGRTLREVSDAARVSLGYLSEVERGRKEASSELLSAICDALDVPLSQLLVEAGEQLARRAQPVAQASAANIDASTKVVIPPVVALALSATA